MTCASFETSSADRVDDDRGLGTGGEASAELKRKIAREKKCKKRIVKKKKSKPINQTNKQTDK